MTRFEWGFRTAPVATAGLMLLLAARCTAAPHLADQSPPAADGATASPGGTVSSEPTVALDGAGAAGAASNPQNPEFRTVLPFADSGRKRRTDAGPAAAGGSAGSNGPTDNSAGAVNTGAPADSSSADGNAVCPPGIARRDGGRLVVDGQAFAFFGVNVQYLLDSQFPEERVEPALAALAERGVNAVRVWFLEGDDPDRLERTLDAGARQGVRFVVTLDDNVPNGRDWFFGDDDDQQYRPHLQRTVARFKDRPEILLWEPTNEPNCGGDYDQACTDTIKDWLTMASRMIKAIDACHLVSSGMIGAGNYDPELTAYRRIHRRDTIDVLSVHRGVKDDRERELGVATELDAPILYGEVYDVAYDDACSLLDGGKVRNERAERVKDDFRDALRDGVDGYLVWDFAAGTVDLPDGDVRHYCGVYGYELDDPLWRVVAEAGLPPPVPWRPVP